MIATGGKAIYGASVGILMLEAQFPRVPGDIGNATTWDFPVLYQIVRGASPDLVVRQGARGTLEDFIQAGRAMVADGADGIATNCGFLCLFQDALRDGIGVPVLSSSLMQVPMVAAMLPKNKRVGVLTISGSTLTEAHLTAAGIPTDTPIGSTEGGTTFTTAILGNHRDLDVDAARADNVQAALDLCSTHPDIGAIVLECTNMVPYAHDIARATGLPVFSMETAIRWFQSALVPRRFPD